MNPLPRACTPRQIQVLALVANGASYRQTACQLDISKRTVEHHVERAKRRMGFGGKSALLNLLLYLALRGIISVDGDN